MNLVALILAALALGLVYTYGLKTTHRIAGPIYAAVKYLKEVAAGKNEINTAAFSARNHLFRPT
jgi:hypothetical protein